MSGRTPLKVMHIIARLNVGGPAVYTISLIDNLSRDFFRSLLVCGKVGCSEGDMSYLAKEKSILPSYIDELGREISFWSDLKSYISLIRLIKRYEPDIIQTHTAKAGTIGRLSGILLNLFFYKKNKIKLVHTFHGHIFHSYFGKLKSLIFIHVERFLGRYTDRIIVISPEQKRDICDRYRIANPQKVRVIPLGFDLAPFDSKENIDSTIRERYVRQGNGNIKLVGVIGRLTKVKNHLMLLNSISMLKEAGKADAFKFLIIGDGELKEELKRYTLELGVSDYIIFTGWQRDMPSIYRALDIVALTSLNEGTPVTLIEAMAAGKPVVSTDVGGVPDLIGRIEEESNKGFRIGENGILIHSQDSKALGNALIYIAENGEKTKDMTKRAREFVLYNYSIERLVRDIETLYSELLIKS